jgi:hypothetical protein
LVKTKAAPTYTAGSKVKVLSVMFKMEGTYEEVIRKVNGLINIPQGGNIF